MKHTQISDELHEYLVAHGSPPDAVQRALIEETAKLSLYIKQFGGSVTLLPDEWVKKLEPIKDFL